MTDPSEPDVSLISLAALVAESVPLENTMLRVAEYAAALAPNAGGAVVATLEDGTPQLTVATSAVVKAADEAQYQAGEGPCLDAVRQREVIVSASIATEPAWPHYAGRVRRLGLHSVLVNPLVLHGTVVAVLSVYASRKEAFGERDKMAAQQYAPPAAAIIRNAEVLARSRREIGQLREALHMRPVIDQAIGIIRSRTGETEAEVFERLRSVSQAEHIKVFDVAARIVDDAVRRALGRRAG